MPQFLFRPCSTCLRCRDLLVFGQQCVPGERVFRLAKS
jgi:hypothetical protein